MRHHGPRAGRGQSAKGPRVELRPVRLKTLSLAITAGLVAVAVVVFTASGFSLFALRSARRRQIKVLDAAVASSSQLLDLYLDQETGLRGFLVTGDTTFLQPYQSATARIPAAESQLGDEVASIRGAPAQLAMVEAAHRAWLDRYAQPIMADASTGRASSAHNDATETQGKVLFDNLRASMRTLSATVATAQRANEDNVGRRDAQLWIVLVVSFAALVAAGATAAVVNQRLVIAPLFVLSEQVAAVADGDLDRRLPTPGPIEIRDLAAGIEAMRDRLSASIESARRSAEALAQEGPAVSALRRALIRRQPTLPGVELAGRLLPSAGVLAGDWWDAFALADGRGVLILGDVSGHGAAAGVHALQLKHLIANAVVRGVPPGQALAAAVTDPVPAGDELFATVFVAVVDLAAGQLSYANAGHPAALLLHGGPTSVGTPADQADGGHDRTTRLDQTGPLLSPIVEGSSWESRTVEVSGADTLVAISDGITEARDAQGEQFGVERLTAVVLDHAVETRPERGIDPATVADAVIEAVRQFARSDRPTDDQTIVVCRFSRPDVGRDDPTWPEAAPDQRAGSGSPGAAGRAKPHPAA